MDELLALDTRKEGARYGVTVWVFFFSFSFLFYRIGIYIPEDASGDISSPAYGDHEIRIEVIQDPRRGVLT